MKYRFARTCVQHFLYLFFLAFVSTEFRSDASGFTDVRVLTNRVELMLQETNDTVCIIETSTNLVDWKLITCLAASNQPVRVVDWLGAYGDQRFYRYRTQKVVPKLLFEFFNEYIAALGSTLFRHPSFSGSTASFVDITSGNPNFSHLTNTYPSELQPPTNVMHISWVFATNAFGPWLRLSTSAATRYGNPTISFSQGFGFDIYTDRDLSVFLGLREATVTGLIGHPGGTSGSIEWVGQTAGRLIKAGEWQPVCFWIPAEPVIGFTGNGFLVSADGTGNGVFEHLAIQPVSGNGLHNVYLANFRVFEPLQ